MSKKYEFSKGEINNMIKMYVNEFQSMLNIATKYNVDVSVIKQRLEKNGINIPKGSCYSKEYWIKRGMTKNNVQEHLKTLRPVSKEFWIKRGYSEDEAKLQIEGQKMVSLRGCIARFGKDEGLEIWNQRENKRSENGKRGSANLHYWINKGHSEEEAKKLLSERQSTFTLEKCIMKYGEEEGKKRFTERQNKWSKSLSSGGNLKIGYSKISQELFYKLLEHYTIKDREKIYFATHNKEFKLDKKQGGIWLYDFTDLKNKKIIEYNGDDYHANPNKYSAEDNPHPFRKKILAKDIWNKDEEKLKIAKENGFKVLVIWDSEYRWGNKEEIINKCLKFLSNESRVPSNY